MESKRWSLLAGFVVAGCGGVGAPEGPSSTVEEAKAPLIIGTDDRIEAYQVTDPYFQLASWSVPAMFLAKELTDEGTYYDIGHTNYTTVAGNPLCKDTKFYNQLIGSGLACTSFFVAPDMVATAKHCLSQWGWDWTKWAMVAGYRMSSASYAIAPYSANKGDVYKPVALVGQATTNPEDWALLQLDHDLPSWKPTYSLNATKPTCNQFDKFATVGTYGHGGGLALKYSGNAPAYCYGDSYFLTELDLIGGNSGGPVFNTVTRQVEGIATGEYVDDYTFDQTAKCSRLTTVPAYTGYTTSTWADYAKPVADLVAGPGAPLETPYASAKLAGNAPVDVVTSWGTEYLFLTGTDRLVYKKTRAAGGAWSAWSALDGYMTVDSSPVVVEGLAGELWVFANIAGRLSYNLYTHTPNTWSNWGTITSAGSIVGDPGVVVLDANTSGGSLTKVVIVSTVTGSNTGQMMYITYTQSPSGSVFKNYSNTWLPGAYAAVTGVSAAATGFGDLAQNAATATIVDGSQHLQCVRGVIPGNVTPPASQNPAITWTPCSPQLPQTLTVKSAKGVKLDNQSVVLARGSDDQLWTTTQGAATSPWSAWSAPGGRIFGTPSPVRSSGTTYATYYLAADRRVGVK